MVLLGFVTGLCDSGGCCCVVVCSWLFSSPGYVMLVGFVAEISYENSIICINFKTEDYDVFVGIYKASPISRFDKIESADGVDLIDHPLAGGTPL